MGSSSWSSDAFSHLSSSRASTPVDDIFVNNKTHQVDKDMSPKGVVFRESRDSIAHPTSLALCVFLDETGSMGTIPLELAKGNLCSLMDTLLKHNVPHPQILFGGVGDDRSDEYPLQVGQFESGNVELDEWLTKIYLESNGGGNGGESYALSWLFAARHTSTDCFEKRNQKGFLFTIGDEPCHRKISADSLKKIFDTNEASDVDAATLLSEARRSYFVYHIHINHGYDRSSVAQSWVDLIGKENLIELDDKDLVAETIASIVAVNQGENLQNITKSFGAVKAGKVEKALALINQNQGVAKISDSGVLSL